MVGDATLTALVASMRMRELAAGEVLVEEGQLGSVCYVVAQGELAVVSGGVPVDTIKSGDVFGESAMIYDGPRVASLRASTEASVWALERQVFQRTVQRQSQSGRQEIHAFLRGAQLFSRLGDRHLWKLADAVEDLLFPAGHKIICEGDTAEAMYIIKAGSCVVSQELDTPDRPEGKRDARLCTILTSGSYFGERALITQEPRSATVEAVDDVSVLRIDRQSFIKLLGTLREKLNRAMPRDSEPDHSPMSRRSSFANAAHLSALMERKASLLESKEGPHDGTRSPSGYSSGDGDDSFNKGQPRYALSEASEGEDSFSMRRREPTRNHWEHGVRARLNRHIIAAAGPAPCAPDKATAPMLDKLTLVRPLGAGGFGRVQLMRHAPTRRVYALKVINKLTLLNSKSAYARCDWVVREKDMLGRTDHPFIIQLICTYADPTHIYFLMAPALGGEILNVLTMLGDEEGAVEEKVARFYITSIALALQYLHSLEVVYRDLKPENVLLDAQGYVKVCDFGFATRCLDRTYTRCGTPEYVAPEMLLGQGVNLACDWWALGVLTYEFLAGTAPFSDPDGDDMKTFASILKGVFHAPATFSPSALSLVSSLLQVKVAERLGSFKGAADDVVGHAWFEGLDTNGLVNLTVRPPWRPALSGPDDTSCFDMEGQSHSYDRLVAEGDVLDFSPADQGEESAEEIENKWRAVVAVFDGSGAREGSSPSSPDGSFHGRSVLSSVPPL